MISRGLSLFSGNALEITHNYRPLCMTFAIFSYEHPLSLLVRAFEMLWGGEHLLSLYDLL